MIRLTTAIVMCATLLTGAQAAEWGSIAYSPQTGATGFSHNYDTKSTAQSWAVYYCTEEADDCRIAVNFQNACGAVARGRNGGWGSSWGVTRDQAQRKALASCRINDSGCRVIRWVCSN